MKDNEFKARNKDTDFSKKVEADTVLGRQSAKGSAKPFTSSEHNRYQQKFLDTEKPLDTSTVQNPSDSQEILKPTENNTEQQEDLENINLDSQPDIPYSPPTNEPPKSGGFSNAVTTAARNKRYQRKFNQKKFDVDTLGRRGYGHAVEREVLGLDRLSYGGIIYARRHFSYL